MDKVFFSEDNQKAAVHKRLLERFKDSQKKKMNDSKKLEVSFKHLCSKRESALRQEQLFNSKLSKYQDDEVTNKLDEATRRMDERKTLQENLSKTDAHLANILDLKGSVNRQSLMVKKVQSTYNGILRDVPILNDVMKKINTVHFRQKCLLYTFISVFL